MESYALLVGLELGLLGELLLGRLDLAHRLYRHRMVDFFDTALAK